MLFDAGQYHTTQYHGGSQSRYHCHPLIQYYHCSNECENGIQIYIICGGNVSDGNQYPVPQYKTE